MNIYLSNETNFERNGLGFLTNCLSATITESLNGDYYLEFEYPVKDKMSDYIVEENIVKCNSQLFRIKKVTKKYDKITVYAYHIFYDLLDNFILDTYPQNLNAGAFGEWILDKTNFETSFTFYSDIGTTASARYVRKNPVEAIMGDIDNSMLNLFGGELERDNFNIKLLASRGENRGVKLLFGKNIDDITITTDITSMYTRICPIGYDGLLLPEKYVDSPLIDNYPTPKIGLVEFSNIKYDETGEDGYSTLEEAYQALRDAVNELYNNGTDKPQINVKVDWVELSKTEQYKNFKAIETVHLGDTINANILGLDYTTRVTKTTYNALTDTIEKFEIGTLQKSIANTVNSQTTSIQEINPTSILDEAKKNATSLITSAMGGYVYKTNNELYIMDTDNPETAQKVWRWNLNGLGYSSTGVNGTYEVAMTSDGKINADMITTGKINTNLIEGYGSLVLNVDGLTKTVEKAITTSQEITDYPIYIEDAGNYTTDNITIYGNSEQETRSGKNLFNKSTANQGYRIMNNSGTLYEDSSYYASDYIPVVAGKTYVRNKVFTNLYCRIAFYDSSKTYLSQNNGGDLNTLTVPDGAVYLRFGGLLTDLDTTQFELGSTSTDYEEYGAMPSPDYPSEVKVVKGKNLFNISSSTYTSNGITTTFDGTKYLTIKGTATSTWANITAGVSLNLEAGTYTISTENSVPHTITIKGSYSDGNIYEFKISANSKYKAFTTTKKIKAGYFYIGGLTNGTAYDETITLQLEKGSVATDYVPYQNIAVKITSGTNSTITNIPLGDNELCKIGNVKDELSIQNGNLVLTKRIKKMTLAVADMNNSEDWPGWKGTTGQFLELYNDYPSDNEIFTNFTSWISNGTSTIPFSLNSLETNRAIVFFSKAQFNMTQTEWKTNYPDLVFTLYYVAPEEQTIDLGTITQPKTYEGINNISVESYIEPDSMYVKYLTDSTLNLEYATKSDLTIAEDQINLQVSKKVGNDEVISVINQSSEQITLKANRLVVESDGFTLDGEGNMTATSGKIAGFEIDSDNGFVYNIYAKYDYTDDDLTTIKEIIMQGTTPTSEQLERYDINGDGKINAVDYGVIQNYIKYGITTTSPGKFEITTAKNSVLQSKIGYYDANGDMITGFNYNSMVVNKKNVMTGETYSYGETEIGTWVDGKPLYRRVVAGTGGSTSGKDIVNISDIDQLITMRGMIKSNYGQWWNIPNYFSSETGYYTSIHYNQGNGNFWLVTGNYYNDSQPFIVILEYTKTTD